ncbi:MAG TPA: hypothetical protein VJ124_13900 [Pyrinomonadaceae bacterium]|nr:hypothetical protein [Pyrinomonadaceae bacterium]
MAKQTKSRQRKQSLARKKLPLKRGVKSAEKELVRVDLRHVNVPEERKRPRLLSILFCDFASFTIDKKVNLLGIFDRIYVHPEQKKTPVFTCSLGQQRPRTS